MDKTTLSDQLKNLFESLDPNKDSDLVVVDMDDLGIPNGGYRKQEKPPAPRATFMDDPLALSCASYRIYRNDSSRRWTNIDTLKATSEDRVHAQAIRDYYNQRYTMQVLKGRELTEYQQKTAQFLSGLYHLTNDELGLLYKLPYFYTEDTDIDNLIESTENCNPRLNKEYTEYTLTPLKEILRTRKSSEQLQFWYKDQDNRAIVIECRANDNLVSLLRGLFRQPKIQVRSYAKLVRLSGPRDHTGLKLFSWELVF